MFCVWICCKAEKILKDRKMVLLYCVWQSNVTMCKGQNTAEFI